MARSAPPPLKDGKKQAIFKNDLSRQVQFAGQALPPAQTSSRHDVARCSFYPGHARDIDTEGDDGNHDQAYRPFGTGSGESGAG